MPPTVTIEVDIKAKYRRVRPLSNGGQDAAEKKCERSDQSHVLQCLGETIECMKCGSVWKNEGF